MKPERPREVFKIDQPETFGQLADEINDLTKQSHTIYIDLKDDLKGYEECGCPFACLQIHIEGQIQVYQVDISHAEETCNRSPWMHAFLVPGHPSRGAAAGRLVDILQSTKIRKVCYDARYPAFLLYQRYGIQMRNVVDLQLHQLAYEDATFENNQFLQQNHVVGTFESFHSVEMNLDTVEGAVQKYTDLKESVKSKFLELVDDRNKMMGGKEPVSRATQKIFSIDVNHLHQLKTKFFEAEIPQLWKSYVHELTEERVNRAQLVDPASVVCRSQVEEMTL